MMARKQQEQRPSRVNEMWERLLKDHSDVGDRFDLEFIDNLPDEENGIKDEFVQLPYAAPEPAKECLW